jgi:hypothetical protein
VRRRRHPRRLLTRIKCHCGRRLSSSWPILPWPRGISHGARCWQLELSGVACEGPAGGEVAGRCHSRRGRLAYGSRGCRFESCRARRLPAQVRAGVPDPEAPGPRAGLARAASWPRRCLRGCLRALGAGRRKRGSIRAHRGAFQVRVAVGVDPSTGERTVRSSNGAPGRRRQRCPGRGHDQRPNRSMDDARSGVMAGGWCLFGFRTRRAGPRPVSPTGCYRPSPAPLPGQCEEGPGSP